MLHHVPGDAAKHFSEQGRSTAFEHVSKLVGNAEASAMDSNWFDASAQLLQASSMVWPLDARIGQWQSQFADLRAASSSKTMERALVVELKKHIAVTHTSFQRAHVLYVRQVSSFMRVCVLVE